MRDFYKNLSSLALATKDTDVDSADSIKLDSVHALSRFSKFHTGNVPDLVACFQLEADCAAGDDFIPYIKDSADGSSWTKKITGDQVGAPAAAAKIYRLPLPKEHRQYLTLGATPKSTGTFTAKTLKVWFEFAPGQNL